jgi:hypothetical protein
MAAGIGLLAQNHAETAVLRTRYQRAVGEDVHMGVAVGLASVADLARGGVFSTVSIFRTSATRSSATSWMLPPRPTFRA